MKILFDNEIMMCLLGKECSVFFCKMLLSDIFFIVKIYFGKYKFYRFILYDVCIFDILNLRWLNVNKIIFDLVFK